MLVTVDVPDDVVKEYRLNEAQQSRQLLEGFILQLYARGKISAGWIGRVLGLESYETEQFLYDHGAPPSITPEQHLKDLATLDRLLAR